MIGRIAGLALAAALIGAAEPAAIPYPEGFEAWRHVTTAIIEPGKPGAPKYEGMHHIYANKAAVQGYHTGTFPDGSVLVYDLWTVAPDAFGQVAAGQRKHVDVMVKDRRRFAATGGWGYAEFMGAERTRVAAIEADPMKSCHGCHLAQRAHDSVFTRLRS